MTIFAEASKTLRITSCWMERRIGEHRMKCRDDGHFEARYEIDDIAAGLATKNSVFVLKRDNVETRNCSKVRHPAHIHRPSLRKSGSVLPRG